MQGSQGRNGLPNCYRYAIALSLHILILLPVNTVSANAEYFSYIGGELNDSVFDSAIDANGNVFLTGHTHSSQFSGMPTRLDSASQDQNCFIAKINTVKKDENLAVIFGGSGKEVCRKIVLDEHENIYLIGETQSNDFSVTNNSQLQGNWDGFLLKFDPQLTLLAGTFIGGQDTDFAHGLSLIDRDKLAIIGETWSTDFPTTDNAYIENCKQLEICDNKTANSFLYIISTDLNSNSTPLYSTYLGGNNNDKAHSVTTYSNLIYITGETQSADFPLINQLSNSLKGSLDAFISVFEFSTDNTASLIFSSYLGGNGDDSAMKIKLDQQQNIILVGETTSDDFPTTQNAFSKKCAKGTSYCLSTSGARSDIFIASISTGYEIIYSTLFGGSNNEVPLSLYVNGDNTFWISGFTQSTDLPLTSNAISQSCTMKTNCSKEYDGFVLKINPQNSGNNSLQYSSYFGGMLQDSIVNLHKTSEKLIFIGESFSLSLASNNASNNTPKNGDAYIAINDLPSDGVYIEKPRLEITNKVKRSSLNPSVLLGLCFIIILLRRVYKNNL